MLKSVAYASFLSSQVVFAMAVLLRTISAFLCTRPMVRMKLLFLVLCKFLFAHLACGEVFTAMVDMEALLGAEKSVTSVIDQYIDFEKRRLERLKSFAYDYEKKNAAALREGMGYLGNPVNAFLLIKRLTSDWSYVESLMKNNMAEDFLRNITSQRQNDGVARFPDHEDLTGAAVALMRLQDTYRLSTADMADGRIQGVKRAEEFQAHDCFELGRVAYNQEDYYHTLLWMNEALERLEYENPPTVEEADILEYLAFSLYQQGNVKRALSVTQRLLSIRPDHARARGNLEYYTEEIGRVAMRKGDADNLPPVSNRRPSDAEAAVPEREAYEALCRGEIPMGKKLLSKLYCYLKMDKPFLMLAPIKVEIVHLNPLAVVFRDVINHREIKKIKSIATPRLARATVHNKQSGKLEFASYRISKSAWLRDDEDEVIARVRRRTADMTNLNMETAEELQIGNYGIGGHYEPHFDMSTRGEKDPYQDNTGNRIATALYYKEERDAFKGLGTGNRIATILYYLEAPDAGGATVFPELRISVFPTKHDCLFWYNLHRDGEGDMRTRHAACPVLSGQKWVGNIWIHERGQEFNRPCAMSEDINENFVGDL